MPKSPQELQEQIEQQNQQPTQEGHSRTAEGLEVPNPSRKQFFADVEKASKPEKD